MKKRKSSGAMKRPANKKMRLASWFVAGLSTAVAAGMLFVLTQISTAWHFARLQNNLRGEFASDTPVAIILGNTKYQSLFSSPTNVSRYYLPIASFLEQEQYDRAANLLQKTPFAKTFQARELQDAISVMQKAASEKEQIESEQREVEESNKKLALRYEQLHLQLTQLLSVPTDENAANGQAEEVTGDVPDREAAATDEGDSVAEEATEGDDEAEEVAADEADVADDADNTEMPLYEAGLLADLPVLEGIPDNITDAKHLRLYLKSPTDGANDSLPFTAEQLTAMQQSGTEMKQILADNVTKAEELSNKLEVSKKNLAQSTVKAREVFSKLLLQNPSSDLNLFTIQSYEHFTGILTKLGVDMPKLWV